MERLTTNSDVDLTEILRSTAKEGDLRTAQAMYQVFYGADKLLMSTNKNNNVENLATLEKALFVDPKKYTTMEHLIAKAALSKARVQSLSEPTHIHIVVPMYHEVVRMSPRSDSNRSIYYNHLDPNKDGEDSLLRKHAEMEWLCKDSALNYQLIFVDDICDQDSGRYAQDIVNNNLLPNVKVLFLGEAVDTAVEGTLRHSAIKSILPTRESIRGGALCLGFAEAVNHTKAMSDDIRKVIGYVDADSSYSLTQLGIPLSEIVGSNAKAVTASRQHELTYMEPQKSESQTSHRSPGLIRLKQVVGHLRKSILGDEVPTDTQSGFKLFDPRTLKATLVQPGKAHNFTYDTQLLSRISRMHPKQEPIRTFGVVCIDSDELSTANNGITYFQALKIVLSIAEETHFGENPSDVWLLNYLTQSVNSYKLARRLLEDDVDPSEWFSEKSSEYKLLLSVRSRIKIDRDTTAVGDYFTPDIAEDLAEVLRKIN